MKKIYIFYFFVLCFSLQQGIAQRYVEEVFTDAEITVETDIQYGINMSVFLQIFNPNVNMPLPDTLYADIYMPDPAIDTETERPIVLMNASLILPQYIISCGGDKGELQKQYVAMELAKRGYVVMVANTRTGANLFAPTSDQFLLSLGSWSQRQSIDMRTAARFIKKDIAENGNTYGVNIDEFINWDVIIGGSGKSQNADDPSDFETPNYFVLDENGNLVNFVDLEINGGIYGLEPGMDPDGNVSNLVNHPGYFEQHPYDLVIGFQGGTTDTFGIEAGQPPFITYLNLNHSGASTELNPVFVPATMTFCCNQFTGQVLQRQMDQKGNLDMWKGVEFVDPVANLRIDYPADPSVGPIEGLIGLSGHPDNSSPWIFWDTTLCQFVADNGGPNPDVNVDDLAAWVGMTPELGMARIDTIIRYWTPRACVLFGWEECASTFVSTKEPFVDANRINVSPNPSAGNFTFETSEAFPMERIQVFNVSGALMYDVEVNNSQITIDDIGLSGGMYFAKIQFEDGIATKKIIVEK